MVLRLRSDQAEPEDEEEVFMGVFAPVMPRKVLAEFQVEVDISKLPRLQPHVFIDPLLLDDDE